MLIECPKCGFSQPKDQYCASCGVDIENFRLKAKPKTQLYANPLLLISVACAIVFLGTLFVIQRQQKQEISRRVEYLKGGPLYSDSADQKPAARSNNTASAPVPPPPPPPPAPVAANPPPTATTNTTQPISATMAARPSESESRAVVAKPVKVKAYYTLISSTLLNQIQFDQPIIQFGPVFRMGQVRNASQVIAKADVLDTTDVKFEGESSEATWIAGDRIADGFLGLQNHIVVHSQEDGTFRGDLEVLRALPEDANQTVTPVSFSGEFAAAPGSAVMISMVLPRVQPPARSMASASKFFRFYRTTDFLSKNSEFVMFLTFE